MLKINNLTKIYKSKKGVEVKALNNVSMDFGSKGLIFILGKSGSGKSTLLNLLGGLDVPDGGEIIVKGKSSKSFTPSDFDSYRNTYVGFIFQEYNLIPSYTVGDNIELALELQGKQADKAQAEDILRKLELIDDRGETLYSRLTNELSVGQKQRVSIARALIKNPEIILADEPTGALDSNTGRELYELLRRLSERKLIIVVTHDRENAEKYGDRIIEIKDGTIIHDTNLSSEYKALTEKDNPEDCTFIKSRLPLRRSLKMGASGLKVKKFRLIVSILLSVAAFIIFGFSLTAAMADEYTAELKTLYAHDMRMIGIEGDSYYNKGGVYESWLQYLMPDQIEEIKKYNNNVDPMPIIYSGVDLKDHLGAQEDKLDYFSYLWNNNPYLRLGLSSLDKVAELDNQTGEKDANLRPDSRFLDKSICMLPKDYDEIAITDLTANMFIKFGYQSDDGTITEISVPDDLIGKTLGELTISGVYSTEVDRIYFEKYDGYDFNYSNDRYLNSYLYGSLNSVISYGFVCKGFNVYQKSLIGPLPEVLTVNSVLVKLSGNTAKDRALFKKLTWKTDRHIYSAGIMSPFSVLVSDATLFIEYTVIVGMIAATVFSIFSALLMMNFLTASIDFKKRELGILRALGARRKDILGICLTESLIIACINFFISLVIVLILCAAFNGYFYLSIFNAGFLQIASLFLLCFGVAALATAIPVIKITNKKPIDIINNK